MRAPADMAVRVAGIQARYDALELGAALFASDGMLLSLDLSTLARLRRERQVAIDELAAEVERAAAEREMKKRAREAPSVANEAIDRFTKNTYFAVVPLDEILACCTNAGFHVAPVDVPEKLGEDDDSYVVIGLRAPGKTESTHWLRVTWHRMPSGRWEVVSYVS